MRLGLSVHRCVAAGVKPKTTVRERCDGARVRRNPSYPSLWGWANNKIKKLLDDRLLGLGAGEELLLPADGLRERVVRPGGVAIVRVRRGGRHLPEVHLDAEVLNRVLCLPRGIIITKFENAIKKRRRR